MEQIGIEQKRARYVSIVRRVYFSGGRYLLSMCRGDAGDINMAMLLVQAVEAISACLDRFKIRVLQNLWHGNASNRINIEHAINERLALWGQGLEGIVRLCVTSLEEQIIIGFILLGNTPRNAIK
jgi:hypothetical protein